MFAQQLSPDAHAAWLDTLADEALRPPSPRPTLRPRAALRWRRSYRGNLTVWHDGQHLTVFRQGGRWCWCITDAETEAVRYSPRAYPSEDAALDALLAAVRL